MRVTRMFSVSRKRSDVAHDSSGSATDGKLIRLPSRAAGLRGGPPSEGPPSEKSGLGKGERGGLDCGCIEPVEKPPSSMVPESGFGLDSKTENANGSAR